MYPVLFVFLEINQSSKCFQVSENVRKKYQIVLCLDKVVFFLSKEQRLIIAFLPQKMNMQFLHIRFYYGKDNKYIVHFNPINIRFWNLPLLNTLNKI